ncbi:MAG: division/cell wall cluster transcriptional repressor MraZ [Chloroflexi bacterium]|nr:division/cell wall cluster transcriptional repressor MraZ [Chloroflexota bacterium]
MFLGEYTHTIDDKGRVTIPARFRAELAGGLVVTRGFDRNLMIYPLTEWQEMAERVAARPVSDESVRAFRRRIFAGATDLEPDRQGRIVLPQYLREFAGIDGEVVVAGMYDYIELWDAEAWREVRLAVEDNDDVSRWQALGI